MRKNSATDAAIHHIGTALPPAAASWMYSYAARQATMAEKMVIIQGWPYSTSATTATIRSVAVRMRFIGLVEDTRAVGRRACGRYDNASRVATIGDVD